MYLNRGESWDYHLGLSAKTRRELSVRDLRARPVFEPRVPRCRVGDPTGGRGRSVTGESKDLRT